MSMFRYSAVRNISCGIGSQALGTLIALFMTPYMVKSLGLETYGLWILVTSFVGYFGLTDLGVRPSVGRFVAYYRGKNDWDAMNSVIVTALGILFACGLLIMTAAAVSSVLFPRLFHVPSSQLTVTRHFLLIAGATIAVGMPLATFDAVILGYGRNDWNYKLECVNALIKAAAIVAIIQAGGGLVSLALSNLAVQVLSGLTQMGLARHLFPQFRITRRAWSLKRAKELYGLGFWVFIGSLWNRLAFVMDNIVIGWALDTKAVAVYSIAGRLVSMVMAGGTVFSSILMPIATSLYAQQDNSRERAMLFGGTRGALVYSGLAGVVCIVFGPELIHVWVGDRFGGASQVLRLLMVPVICCIAGHVIIGVLMARGAGIYRWIALALVGDAVANVVLSVLLARRWGMTGVAYGTLCTTTVTMFLVLPSCACRVLSVSYWEYLRKTYISVMCLPVVLAAVLLVVKLAYHPTGLLAVGGVLTAGVAAYFVAAYYFYFPRQSLNGQSL